MHEYHELTEILYDEWHMKTGKDVMDVRIRAYLKEKAEEIAILGDSAYSVGIETANKILGLTEKSLEEKFIEAMAGKSLPLKDGYCSIEKYMGMLADIATDHFNQQGER